MAIPPIIDPRNQVAQLGFCILPEVLAEVEVLALLAQLGSATGAGRRGMLRDDMVRKLASSSAIVDLVQPHLPRPARPVRAIYFNKSEDINWLVPWHQDLTIAVREPAELEGFGPWTMKDGIHHVQPPMNLLEQMVTIRIHLDDADDTNGALKVLPGTHATGRLSAEQISQERLHVPEVICSIAAGGALLMRPLLLHSSGRSRTSRHRRVLHIEYAGFDLPDALDWSDEA